MNESSSSEDEEINVDSLRMPRHTGFVKSKEQMKNQQIYGVFDTSEDQTSKVDSYGPLRYKPMAFTSSKSTSAEKTDSTSSAKKVFQPMLFTTSKSTSSENELDKSPKKQTMGMMGARNPMMDSMLNSFQHQTEPPKRSKQSPGHGDNKPNNLKKGNKKDAEESTYGIGAKLLQQMGYVKGQGLGKDGKGILNPIEHKLRPQKLGIGGIKERTKQSIEEAKRRGENVEEEQPDRHKSLFDKSKPKSSALSEREQQLNLVKRFNKVLAELKLEGLQIPEGLQLISDFVKSVLDEETSDDTEQNSVPFEMDQLNILKQAVAEAELIVSRSLSLKARITHAEFELKRHEQELDEISNETKELEDLINSVKQLAENSELDNAKKSSEERISSIIETFNNLKFQYLTHVKKFHLDELALSVIYPIIKETTVSWNPLKDPKKLRDIIAQLKALFRISTVENLDDDDDVPSDEDLTNPIQANFKGNPIFKKKFSYYDLLILHYWFPIVQRALKDSWDPTQSHSAAIMLFEEWNPLIPNYLNKYLYDEIIVPRILDSIATWKPLSFMSSASKRELKHKHLPPHSWIFPWLPYLSPGELDLIINEVKERYASLIKSWRPADKYPIEGLEQWKHVFSPIQFQNLVKSSILPRFSKILQSEKYLQISSRPPFVSDTTRKTLEAIFSWCPSIVKPTELAECLKSEFFPEWEEYLYEWLIESSYLESPDPSSKGISQEEDAILLSSIISWYEAWYLSFPTQISDISSVHQEFDIAINMIDEAVNIDPAQRATRLPKPPLLMGMPSYANGDNAKEADQLEMQMLQSRLEKSNLAKESAATEPRFKLSSQASLNTATSSSSINDKNGQTNNAQKVKTTLKSTTPTPTPSSSSGHEAEFDNQKTTFRDLVEEVCAEHNLFLVALDKAHPSLGYPLYRISPMLSGAGGMTCYFNDNVLWVKSNNKSIRDGGNEYNPISLDEINEAFKNFKAK